LRAQLASAYFELLFQIASVLLYTLIVLSHQPEIREVVETTARLLAEGREEVRQADLKGSPKS
jgi:hypothetical protein